MRLVNTTPRLTWIILGSSLLLALIVAGSNAHRELQALQADHRNLAQGLTRQLARAGHLALLAGDRPELREIARSVLSTDPVLGRVIIENSMGKAVVDVADPPLALSPVDRWAARAAALVSRGPLEMTYTAQIPPVGEGSLLDPFGTPRAGVGRTTLALSQSEYTRELAGIFYAASLIWILLFAALTATGYGIAWLATLPMLRLRRSLRAISGDNPDGPAVSGDYHDIERSLEVIGQRISRSEDQAREATEALHGQAQQLELAREHARNAARMRADLVAGMSHELRTPLSAILSHSDLLARSVLDTRQRDYVATVRKSAGNLLRLIDDVLEWSGIEAGKASLNEVGFNLAEIVEDTVDLLAPLAYEKDLELVHMIYQDVPLRLRGDPQRFQQILTNLVSNAIKFTASGGITIRIMLDDEDSDEDIGSASIRVSVADTGPGIDSAAQDRLFDMYERLDRTAAVGSGLGLAISKRLLEMMGGSISVDSTPGQGAEFQFTVPMKKALHREQNTVPWADLQGLRVWLQDDYRTSRLALAHHLEAWRMDVFEMDTRNDLQACLEDNNASLRPAMVVIGLSAVQAGDPDLHALLAACRGADLPVLTLVTSIDADIHKQLEAAGAHSSLPKSVNRLQLYRRLCETAGIKHPDEDAQTSPLTGLNVLIADNSAAARGYLATLLASLGAGVAQAEEGHSALDAWRKGMFPLVILDEQMPGCTGTEVVRRIRALASAQTQPVVIGITADSRPQIRTRLMQAGMDACLVKPFDAQQLLRSLQPYLGRLSLSEERQLGQIQRAEGLAADPKLSALLERDLPQQLNAVREALTQGDNPRAKAEIHTLHGTAAFYGLGQIRAQAMRIETALGEGQEISAQDMNLLETTVTQAVARLNGKLAASSQIH